MNAFDFSNLEDIKETNPELAAKVANAAQDKIDAVIGIFKAGSEAGVNVLSIAQLSVAAIRMDVELPAAATVRKYINDAVAQGSLKKVTRQTYALADADVEVSADAGEDDMDDLPDV